MGMSDLTCPHCGESLPPNSPAGLCPRCLMRMNMATQTRLCGEEAAPGTALPPAAEEIARHFPNFEILECLGRGGMGVVYKARQKSLNRLVALKLVAPEREKDAAFARRFALEAETLAKLNHPGIVTIYDFGQADGLFYLVMEFVDGVTLRRLLDAGRVSPREALAIVPQICDALQYAHDQGIVHRDIKPENILLDRRGRVKVADFGVAKLVQGENEPISGRSALAGPTSLTGAGKTLGTPRYMAPEQVQHPAEVDHRADIYALGVVLYQMLTGELPGPKLQPPSKKVQIDVRLDEIVLLALETDPQRRYQQASDMKTAVEIIASDLAAQQQKIADGSSKAKSEPGSANLAWARAIGQRAWLYAFAAGILAVLLFEFAASVVIMEARPVAFALGLPAGGVAVVILLLARKQWLGGFLACVAFVFFLWLALAAVMSGPFALGLASGIAALAMFIWVIKKPYFPPGFLVPFLSVHLLIFGVSALVTAIMPESFVSTARVEIQRREAQPAFPGAPFLTSGSYDPYFIQTEFEVIQSETVLGHVIEELQLQNKWGQRYGHGQPLTLHEARTLLLRCLDTRPVRNANLIEIRVFSDRPDEAATIANQVAEDYQALHRRAGVAGETSLSHVRVQIVDMASPGLRPVRPNKPMNLAIGALAGLLLGTIVGNGTAARKAKRNAA